MAGSTVSSTGTTVGQSATSIEKSAPITNVRGMAPPRASTADDAFHKRVSLDLDDYFVGPRDMSRHSKWPMFLRMHGSIIPKLILPLLFVGAWATAVTVISFKVHHLGVDSVLLTITGFTISLGLSFRSSTAYERYAEGRRYWATLATACQAMGRIFWVHATDPEGQDPRELMLRKITSMNLIVAFAHSLKHSLRFEPYTAYPDMQHLVGHLDLIAHEASTAQPDKVRPPNKNFFKETGEYLGVSFATSNPRKAVKKSDLPLGNIPLELMNYISMAVDEMVRNGQLEIALVQSVAYNTIGTMNDVVTGCHRVLNTPLPLAYAIAITQITWVYVMLLPFQLIPLLGWIAIPATVAAAYIILGLLLIGAEIENPFGHDVNDLPLDKYCEDIAADMDVIARHEKRDPQSFMTHRANMPLYPASTANMSTWLDRGEDKIREAIRNKPAKMFSLQKRFVDGNEPADNMV